ncbi:MAG: DUF2306 domain-containing protein [Proteobacteria bacterium]|nr:DUF2306 domain-containing protein [Pseudomonadota bacterium]
MKAESVLAWIVGFLALAGIGGAFFFLSTGGNNEGFAEFPTITNLHVIPGAVYLALAPFQFSSTIRDRNRSYHRWAGRLLSSIALVAGAGALFLGVIIPFSGLAEQIVTGFFGTVFLIATVKGFTCARAGNFTTHREWMMRAFAIALSIATMRLIFVPTLIIIGNPTREEAEFYSITSFTIAFILHSGFAEYWIRRTRTKSSSSNVPKPAYTAS